MTFELPDYLHGRALDLLNSSSSAVDEIREKIKDASLPSEKERRRYALLQAAAAIYRDQAMFDKSVEYAVNWAEELLVEIEKRETPSPRELL